MDPHQVCTAMDAGLSQDEIAALLAQGGRFTFTQFQAWVAVAAMSC